MEQYFNCHSHTMYSNIRLLDSINKPKDLINKAIELGLNGIAITDHECLSAHIKVNKYAKEIKSKYPDFTIALGNEIYLVENYGSKQKYYHFILIAKDAIGHKILRELSSKAWENSYSDRGMERVVTLKADLENKIKDNPGHIIATTACRGGELSTLLFEEQYKEAEDFIKFCIKIFGQDFYIECAPSTNNEQILINQRLYHISQKYSIPLVVGTDAHYLTKKERYVHKAYLNSSEGEREVDDFYEFAHLMDYNECLDLLNHSFDLEVSRKILKNTNLIKEKISFYDLTQPQKIPKVKVIDYSKGHEGWFIGKEKLYPVLCDLFDSENIQERYWVNQCYMSLLEKEYNKQIPEDKHNEYIDRLELEADVIKYIGEKLGDCLFSYFNTFKHYIDLFWECGSIVGPGRGSSTGFLSNYLLGITQLDPIKWELPWYRFLNKERVELPDIDIDLAPSVRPLIFEKIREERGKYGLIQVATFGTEKSKSAILAACFKKGTKVLTQEGEKEIQNLTDEDIVYSSNGWEKVIAPTKMSWNNNFISLKGNYGFEDEIVCTDNHEFLVLPKTNNHRIDGVISNDKILQIIPEYESFSDSKKSKYRNYIRNIQPQWVQAKNLKEKDYLLSRIDLDIQDIDFIPWKSQVRSNSVFIKQNIQINNDFCELLGIWLAEGSLNRNVFSFTISSEEKELKERILFLMNKVFGLTNSCIIYRKNHSIVIQYASADLRDFVYALFNITHYSEINQWNKYIPKILKKIHPQKQLQIFKGWIMGDGSYRERSQQQWSGSKELKGTTVSRQLCFDMKKILHRNFINPSIIREKREGKAEVYNLVLSGALAKRIGEIKYGKYDRELNIQWEDRLGKDLPCVYNDNFYMRYQIKEINIIENSKKEEVYCLMVPSQNFTISDIIVHNCRGYRSEDFPNGIDVDIAQYMSSLIPSERGFLWEISEVVFGNKEKDRKPIKAFIDEVNKYSGLLDIMLSIEGIINKRSVHASGVILYDDEEVFDCGAFMRTPNGDLITAYDLKDVEASGGTKYDLLVTEITDKLIVALNLLQEDNIIDKSLSLREIYNQYLHPEIIDTTQKVLWEHLEKGDVLDVFQFNEGSGIAIAKKLKPSNILEMTAANAINNIVATLLYA